ncbi:hypothetical protein HY339_03040 [Candidatus Gottesmanbacteria bacterium]|nr:hypothetical protein [Candidatus Gottesmanbacteria bacterium]
MSATNLLAVDSRKIVATLQLGWNALEDEAHVVYTHARYLEENPDATHRAFVTGHEPNTYEDAWEILNLGPDEEVQVSLAGKQYIVRHEAEG